MFFRHKDVSSILDSTHASTTLTTKHKHPYRLEYHMLSQSTKRAIRLTSDESGLATREKDCRKDPIFFILPFDQREV